jgi:membrane protein YdbS with pleckstrin-like domain
METMSDGPADPVANTESEAAGTTRAAGSADSGDDSVADTDHATEPEGQTFDDRLAAAREALARDETGIDPELLDAYTTDRLSLNTLVQLQWGVWTTVGVVLVTLVLTFGISSASVPLWLVLPAFGLVAALGAGLVRLRYRLWVYQIREDALYLERGVLLHRRTLVPYVRIQHVDTSRGPLERALGLSTLVVYTAGSRGADVSIPGLTPEQARDLQGRVKDLAIEAEGGDAV